MESRKLYIETELLKDRLNRRLAMDYLKLYEGVSGTVSSPLLQLFPDTILWVEHLSAVPRPNESD